MPSTPANILVPLTFTLLLLMKNSEGFSVHRDGDCLALKADNTINFGGKRKSDMLLYTIWVPLNDVIINNSTLCILDPKNERVAIDNFWGNSGIEDIDKLCKDKNYLIQHNEWVSAAMKKGDAVIFRGDVVHASTDNVDGIRSSFELRLTNIDYNNLVRYSVKKILTYEKTVFKEFAADDYIIL
jgi:ectoine hydroxylase-related dioxygenase (phytanoyl-CoA dioxygenase family)